MTSSTRVFWWSGIVSIGITELLGNLGWLGWVPVVGPLVQRGGAAGAIATAVLGTSIWVLLLLITLNRQLARERRLTHHAWLTPQQRADAVVAGSAYGLPTGNADVLGHPDLVNSRYRRRLTVFQRRSTPGDRGLAEFLLSARSAVDGARSEAPYGPIRALVWALPALGFLGTAAEMSSSIGGVGSAVARTSSYSDLRDFLAQNVIPPLANAFGITLFALACSVICHILVSITHAREERFAIEVDDWALDQLAEKAPADPAGQVISINGDIDRLAREVAAWRGAVATSSSGAEQTRSELMTVLVEMSEQLGEICDGLDRELIVSPRHPGLPERRSGR
jgi:hypothetical protein